VQNIVIDKPYRFVPPRRAVVMPLVIRLYLRRYLRTVHGVESVEIAGTEALRASLDAGHGILLTPNHCRPCDPMVLGLLGQAVARPFYTMASWHLFMQSRLQAWLLPRLGVFSVYREGMDRDALKCAIHILAEARRPLVVFPEGFITRSNDRLGHLMEGIAFMARSAAKQRAGLNPPGQVVVHPVAIRYLFRGNLAETLAPVLEETERRLSWRPRSDQPLLERIAKVGLALLTLKEMEYFGQPQAGTLAQRLAGLVDRLLGPLEAEWLRGRSAGDVVGRIKALRTAILPDLVAGEIPEDERARRWRQLADLYLAQQVACYPPDYLGPEPTPEQMLETVERFEEDLTDQVRVHRPLHAVVAVGEAIGVSPARERGAETDALMATVRERLESMLRRPRETHDPRSVPR
jgi:1-acyl-sn-glycerol-3-phosphate acyltransferase